MFYGSVGRVGLRALLAATAYTPASLFANGEQGVWLDNSDFTTLFQDAAGTTPVTGYEQFVGLRLDKSKGLVLGSELVTNGNFSNGTTGWTAVNATLSVVSEQLVATQTGGSYVSANTILSGLTIGSTYRITATVVAASGVTNTQVWVGSTAGAAQDLLRSNEGVAVPYTRSYVFVAGATSRVLQFVANATSGTLTIDNISVRELPGNHAYQTTTTARAVLSARYNVLTYTEAFDNAAWSKGGVTVAAGFTDSLGTARAWKLQETIGTSEHFISISPTGVSTTTNRWSIDVKAGERNYALLFGSGIGGAYFNLTDGSSVNYSSPPDSKGSIPLGGGWWRIWIEKNGTPANCQLYVSDTGSRFNYPGTAGSGIYFTFADLRVDNESSALPAYQRVGAAVNGTSTSIGTPDYDTVGFPAYLRYDGGDWYQTNSIDFSAGATNPPLGPELVTNGNFSTDTSWTKGSGWTISGGAALHTGAFGILLGPLTYVNGNLYLITYDLTITSGSASVRLGSSFTPPSRTASGSYRQYQYGDAGSGIVVYGTFEGSIDNISVKEVDANYAPDKMSVFAGVRKLDDAQQRVIVELSASIISNNGAFLLDGPTTTAPNYRFASKGTVLSLAETPLQYAAPVTSILTGLADISADGCVTRVNGQQVFSSTTDQGTGTYGNYPLYIGARGGTALFFTGREYETIVLGRAVTATELANTEGYMEAQTFGKDMSYVYSDELTTATGDLITAADGDQIYMQVSYV